MRKLAVLACLGAVLLLGACAGYQIMPSHNMKALLDLKETKSEPVQLDNKTLVLVFSGDKIPQPLGALYIPEIVQEYSLEAPGFVLFEKITTVLKEGKATVSKVYTNRDKLIAASDPQATVVALLFEDLEFHQYKTDKAQWYLGRMVVSYSIGKTVRDANSGTWKKATVSVKVPVSKDLLKELALKFSAILAGEVK